MIKTLSRAELRNKRHLRVRKKVLGTSERPRVCVFRSCRSLRLQLVDDMEGCTLCSLSTLGKELKEKKLTSSKNMEAARVLAEMFAQRLKEKNITTVVFDRSGYRYHGKVKAMADVLREQGLLA
jgi:large subunit ribosomal protein L18